MKILVLNAGSSSLKYQLLDMEGEKLIAKGLVERIGQKGSKLTHKVNGEATVVETYMPTHVEAIQNMLAALTDPQKGVLKNMDDISAVGHRVLHGGEKFSESVIINDDVIAAIEENIPLGPLHNPANLMGIQACQQVMPNTPQVAVFDTAFHQTMPKKAYLYGVPKEYYEKLKIRRYGFHGTSHRYVSKRVCDFLGIPQEGTKVITCHLGNGSSLAAVKDGKCVDTSMGITPLEGLVMGTRCGSMDPAVVQFIVNNSERMGKKMDVNEVLDLLNKKSGMLGLSGGRTSDMRDIESLANAGDEDCIVARDMLVYGIIKYIGAYAAAMNGVDVITFTAGIGENGPETRQAVCEGLSYLGVKIDKELNNCKGKELVISTPDSKVTVCVTPTDEELVIARDTLELVSK
ncbi:MAG: acetate kinase [Clostridia bacterium]|nr:acetate kinase [Clostridia bacterium]